MHIPPLQAGDKVAIISTARLISFSEIEVAVKKIKEHNYIPIIGNTIDANYLVFAGDDLMRAQEFQKFLDDPDIKAILFARGGYGTIRILDKIDFSKFLLHPKWLCGFSDITLLHSHINDKLAVPTVHSAMPFNFPTTDKISIDSLFDILSGILPNYFCDTSEFNIHGIAEGEIIGGNLSILYSLLGTRFGFNSAGKILFIEEVDEYLYHVDRMLISLKLAGKLQHLKGLVVGGFTQMKDNKVSFGLSVNEIILEHVKEYKYPVVFNFPAGHSKINRAMILGKKIKLISDKSGSTMQYI
ncbi:MAG: LD-carboxypeptidase [Bacteroidetes bacterium]|nr:LD-carboxypeptidase [Bacteroidota bacterium]